MKVKLENIKIKKILDNFSFPKNSIFFIHTDISNYDIRSNNWFEKCKNLYSFFDDYFKSHTILVPTFTPSFCKTKLFYKDRNPSEVGIFTEYFRNQKNVKRSNHPMFSVAGKGALIKPLTENLSSSSTGDGSIFERLKVFDSYIIFFGSDFIESCTFLHYVEQFVKVNYRYSKYFNGKVVEKDKVHKGKWEFYVRNTEVFKFKELNRGSQIERDLKKNKILIEKKLGNLKISYCSSRKLFDFVTKKILTNESYILGAKPIKL
jgi:aminoglycoside 3-N-acetyltransferase|tara:strand:- start:1776 stop:2561 length:786 start_codon:yes stop_codon:yes gene_type:complete